MRLSQLSLSEVTGSEKNLIAQLVSQLSLLSEIIVQGTTNIGQLVSQLLLSDNVLQGKLLKSVFKDIFQPDQPTLCPIKLTTRCIIMKTKVRNSFRIASHSCEYCTQWSLFVINSFFQQNYLQLTPFWHWMGWGNGSTYIFTYDSCTVLYTNTSCI